LPLTLSALLSGLPLVAAAEQWEAPPQFQASAVLPPDLRQGSGWTVDEAVRNDGINNIYTLSTDAGPLTVVGTELLKVRVREMAALAQMEQIKRSGVYADAVTKSATSPLRFAGDLVTSPGETMTNAAKGMGQMFSNVGHALFGSPSDHEEGVAKAALGVATAKRQFAKQFGVDPYSSNEPMQTRLNELAWAGAAGGLTVGTAFGAIGGPASGVLRGTKMAGGAASLVYDSSPEQLKAINGKKLAAMGVDATTASAFLDHPKLSPTDKTYIVAALEQMRGVAQRGILVEDTLAARNDAEAFQCRLQAEMLANYHRRVAPLVRIMSIGGIPAAETKAGTLALVIPGDYFAWTQALDREVQEQAQLPTMPKGITRKEFWFAGQVSPSARSILEAGRWTVHDQAAQRLLPGAAPSP
jgi:hypothetical protein